MTPEEQIAEWREIVRCYMQPEEDEPLGETLADSLREACTLVETLLKEKADAIRYGANAIEQCGEMDRLRHEAVVRANTAEQERDAARAERDDYIKSASIVVDAQQIIAARANQAEARVRVLEEALRSLSGIYSAAQDEGCDSNGAFDCVLEAAQRVLDAEGER